MSSTSSRYHTGALRPSNEHRHPRTLETLETMETPSIALDELVVRTFTIISASVPVLIDFTIAWTESRRRCGWRRERLWFW